jgi:23S rRNA (guanine745-N1)-methyltransferase
LITPFTALVCPLDSHPLTLANGSWSCTDGHSFDVARQGYCNMLAVQNKRSRDPGDSRDMVAARSRFLQAGFYQPLAAAVTRQVLLTALPAAPLSCLDAGCGEGYYLRELAAGINDDRQLRLAGVDISKWAVQAAARQSRQVNWLVASNAQLPVASHSIDRLLCLFGFPTFAEFARVVKPGGELLLAEAGPAHLQQLREMIYPELKPLQAKPLPIADGFQAVAEELIGFDLALNTPQAIADLLAMTPHMHRATPEGRSNVLALPSLKVGVEVRLVRLLRDS